MKRSALPGSVFSLLFAIWIASASADPLQNGDFVGFGSWSAGITDSTTLVTAIVDPASDAHFSLLGGGSAQLSNDVAHFEVVLFQEIDIPGDAALLSFDYAWSLTDPASDFPQAAILDPLDPLSFLSLFPASTDLSLAVNSGTASIDISALAGQVRTLQFLLQAGDMNEADSFQIGNVEIIPMPEPTSGGLVLLALAAGMATHHHLRKRPDRRARTRPGSR
jgi:hypothetical protein